MFLCSSQSDNLGGALIVPNHPTPNQPCPIPEISVPFLISVFVVSLFLRGEDPSISVRVAATTTGCPNHVNWPFNPGPTVVSAAVRCGLY